MRWIALALTGLLPVSAMAADSTATAYQVKPSHNALVTFKGAWGPKLSLTWKAALDGYASFPLWDGKNVDALVAGPSGFEIISIDGKSGAVRWDILLTQGGQANGLAYDKGTLFTVQASGAVTALSPKTGKVLWTTTVTGTIGVFAGLTALNGIVYVMGGGFTGELYALDGASGKLLWTQTVAEGNGVAPTVTASGVYVANGCSAYDFAPATGAAVWQYNGGCSGGFSESVVFDNEAYFLNPGYSNVILNAATGSAAGGFVASATPAIHGYVGYFLENAVLSAASTKSGKVLWSFTGDGSVNVPPIVVNNDVIEASQNGNLYVLDSKTGKAAWTGALGQPVARPMGAGGGMLFVPLSNNALAAYGSAG